ncbi:MAG TPA: M13 family metallopeptidase N-terminal domain-containing protein, partial [Sphingomicrobium sp.]
MNRRIALLAAGTALSACAANNVEAPPPPEVAPPAVELVAPPPPAPKAELGTFGFDQTGMNRSVHPGDYFYEYANGTWARNTEIPADKSNYSMFAALQDLSQQRTQEILNAAKDDPNSKIGTAYASFLDEATVEAKGMA